MSYGFKDAFLPDGIVGSDGIGVGRFRTNDPTVFGFFRSFAEKKGGSEGVVYPYELNGFTVFRNKKCFFRPTDVIYTADEITSFKDASKKANFLSVGLYELFVSCPSFTVDTSLIGNSDVASLAERLYFVIPAAKTRLVKKISFFTSGLRKCGVVTSDGMIRFIMNGDAEEFEKSQIPAVPPVDLVSRENGSFNAGCFDAFGEYLAKLTRYVFPAEFRSKAVFNDKFTYKLGRLAVSSRVTSDKRRTFGGETGVNYTGFHVSVIPLCTVNGIFPSDYAFSLLSALKNEETLHNYCVFSAFSGRLEDYVNLHPIESDKETAAPRSDGGYIVIISDTPTAYSHIGRII